jgi:NAD(P)-dependent dehydrogenase (short-subunit alcohol dehydrogenase family)
MAEVEFSETVAQSVRGRVVVVTGGAQGIGAATVTLLHSLGARVVFGDIDVCIGAELEASLSENQQNNPGSGATHFVKVDVCSYTDQLALFEDAFRRYGRVDAGVTCAAVTDNLAWFDPATLTVDDVRTESAAINAAINTNFTSVAHFTRLAMAYMNASPVLPGDFTPSLTLTSSLAGITWATGQPICTPTFSIFCPPVLHLSH